ncbi:hypothetical protein GCM10027570_34340 [Streptomonospora sediminis]
MAAPKRPRPILRPPTPPSAADCGATAIGYAGVAILACALGIALFGATDHGRRILTEVERAVCAALGLGPCPTGRDHRADPLRPKVCAASAQQVSASAGVSVAASPSGRVRIGERHFTDGTAEVSLTRAVHGTADAPNPFRWGAGLGPAEAEAGLGAGVHGGAAATSTWVFPSKHAADRFRERVARSEHLDGLRADSGAFDALGARIAGGAAQLLGDGGAAGLPPPDRRAVTTHAGVHLAGDAGVELHVGGDANADRPADSAGGGAAGTAGAPDDPGNAADTSDPAASDERRAGVTSGPDLLHLVSAGAEGNAELTRTTDDRRGTVSQTVAFEFAETGAVGPLVPESVLSPGHAHDRLARAALTTTRDRGTGDLEEVVIEVDNSRGADGAGGARGNGGDGGGHVVGTARLEVTDRNRATVRRWLAAGESLRALSFLSTTGRPTQPAAPQAAHGGAGEGGGAGRGSRVGRVGGFDELLYREGTYSTVRYATETTGREFSADATLGGLSFGGATGWESVSRAATGARYLAAPGPHGRRELVPFAECAG